MGQTLTSFEPVPVEPYLHTPVKRADESNYVDTQHIAVVISQHATTTNV